MTKFLMLDYVFAYFVACTYRCYLLRVDQTHNYYLRPCNIMAASNERLTTVCEIWYIYLCLYSFWAFPTLQE